MPVSLKIFPIVELDSFLGFLTMVVCFGGIIALAWQAGHYLRLGGQMGARLGRVFLSDAALYFITLLFGLATFFDTPIDHILYPTRIILLLLHIWCRFDLTKPVVVSPEK